MFLGKGFIQFWDEIIAHSAAGIIDNEFQHRIFLHPLLFPNPEVDAAAGRGEFDCVGQDIDQDLLKFHGVADIIIV